MINPLENTDQVRKIPPYVNPEMLDQDLKELTEKALKSGVTDVAVVEAADIIFDTGILLSVKSDNSFPSIHWPLDYPLDDVEEAIMAFHKGIFFKIDTKIGIDYGGRPIFNPSHREEYQMVYQMVSLLESISFYKGYHLALGFATGNCRSIFCYNEKRCLPMLKGKPCLYPNKGRPSMAAAGIDARKMAKALGWEVKNERPLLAGLVMVA